MGHQSPEEKAGPSGKTGSQSFHRFNPLNPQSGGEDIVLGCRIWSRSP
jgi:hypothetical protein